VTNKQFQDKSSFKRLLFDCNVFLGDSNTSAGKWKGVFLDKDVAKPENCLSCVWNK
jgi:hypothetical protein